MYISESESSRTAGLRNGHGSSERRVYIACNDDYRVYTHNRSLCVLVAVIPYRRCTRERARYITCMRSSQVHEAFSLAREREREEETRSDRSEDAAAPDCRTCDV